MNSHRTNHAHGFNLAVAQQLDDARVAHRWTVEALAAQLPTISLRSLERYLTGEAAITIENLDSIASAIGVSMAEIVQAAKEAESAGPIEPRPRQKVRPSSPDSGVDALAETLRRAKASRKPTAKPTQKGESGRAGSA